MNQKRIMDYVVRQKDFVTCMADFLDENKFYQFTDIDKIILEYAPKSRRDAITDECRAYSLENIGEKRINDLDLFTSGKVKFSSMKSVLVTTMFCVNLDLQDKGPLYLVSKNGQENLDIGYVPIMYKGIFRIYIERLKRKSGEKALYHLHASVVPREYKPNRHSLILL